jgi:hypothetical protein
VQLLDGPVLDLDGVEDTLRGIQAPASIREKALLSSLSQNNEATNRGNSADTYPHAVADLKWAGLQSVEVSAFDSMGL